MREVPIRYVCTCNNSIVYYKDVCTKGFAIESVINCAYYFCTCFNCIFKIYSLSLSIFRMLQKKKLPIDYAEIGDYHDTVKLLIPLTEVYTVPYNNTYTLTTTLSHQRDYWYISYLSVVYSAMYMYLCILY